jgi:hypothetical protein
MSFTKLKNEKVRVKLGKEKGFDLCTQFVKGLCDFSVEGYVGVTL